MIEEGWSAGLYVCSGVLLHNRVTIVNNAQYISKELQEMISVWSDGYVTYPDLIIIHIPKCHIIPHKYVQLVCVNLKTKNWNLKKKMLGMVTHTRNPGGSGV